MRVFVIRVTVTGFFARPGYGVRSGVAAVRRLVSSVLCDLKARHSDNVCRRWYATERPLTRFGGRRIALSFRFKKQPTLDRRWSLLRYSETVNELSSLITGGGIVIASNSSTVSSLSSSRSIGHNGIFVVPRVTARWRCR